MQYRDIVKSMYTHWHFRVITILVEASEILRVGTVIKVA